MEKVKEEVKDQDITEDDVTQMSDEDLKKEITQTKTGTGKEEETIKPEEKAEVKVSPGKKEDKKTEVKTEISSEEFAKLKKQVEDKEGFIQKQATEIGTLRKKVKEFEIPHDDAKTRERINEKFTQGDVLGATEEAILDIDARRGKQKELIKSLIPNIEEIKEDIANLVREEASESEEAINLFIANPYVADPVKLRYWAALVMHKKDKETLSKKVGELEKELQNRDQNVLKKIEKAAQETKTLTTKTGAETEVEEEEISEEQIPYLSDEEIKKRLKKITPRQRA